MSIDLSIIGVVFALILLIVFFSAIVLYLAFRVKETFRRETRRSFVFVKITFLLGILFLAGGVFYFSANTIANVSRPYTSPASSTTPYLDLSVSIPSSVTFNALCNVSFTVINPTTTTAHGASIQAITFFTEFTIEASNHEVVGNVIDIGDVPPGTTPVSLQLLAPNKPGTVSDTVTLLFQEMTAPVTQEITISIQGGPNQTPSPIPTPSPTSEPVLYISASYPSSVSPNSNFTISFTIRNPTNATAHGVTIGANVLFTDFYVVSSTREVVGNVVNVGDVPQGVTIISLQLQSPTRPATISDTVILSSQEIPTPVTEQVTISVRGGQP